MKSEHNRGARLADLLRRRRAVLRQGRGRCRRLGRRQGGGEMAAAGQALSDAADEDVSERRSLAQGAEANGIQLVPTAVGMNVDRIQGPARLHLRRLVPRRLPDRRARQSGGDLSRRGAKGQRRSARAQHRHARSDQSGRHPRHRRRILRREKAEAGAGGERRHPRRLVGAESAHPAQLGDRQASRRGLPTRTSSSASS